MGNVYPTLFRRIQAVFLDSIIVLGAVFSLLIIFSEIAVVASWLKVSLIVLLIFLLEPFLVSKTGGTIGHHLFKLRVQRANVDKKLSIFQAIIRFIVKTILGSASVLAMLISKRAQALHDILVNSVVVYKSLEGISESQQIVERTYEDEKENYASKGRRIGVIFIYWLIVTAVLNFLMYIFLSTNCLINEICTSSEEFVLGVFGLFWIILLTILAILGWVGRLYGCRK